MTHIDQFEDTRNVTARGVSPWEANPYGLVNWWDMEKFSAERFYAIGVFLGRIRRTLESLDLDMELEGTVGKVYHDLAAVREGCQEIGLRTSLKCIDKMLDVVSAKHKVAAGLQLFRQLESTMQWEMEDKLFMYVPPDRAEYYNKPEPFGSDFNEKFPKAQFDAIESGNCYACGRGTACVFHLMRIMEVGVQHLGEKLKVEKAGELNWQVILDGVNKAIKALNPKDAKTIELSQAAANLYSVKLAWRNEVMHPKATYTLEEADNLMRQVSIFMVHLAQIT